MCVVGRIFSLHPFFFSGFGYNRLARTHTQTKIGVSYLPYKDATSRRYVQKISLYLNIIYISIYIYIYIYRERERERETQREVKNHEAMKQE